ncbi:major head protein [Bacillus phage PSYJ-YH]|nr:major head protein [Bacillus phage PSYJ-YH]
MAIKIKPQDNGMFWQNNGANISNVTDTQDVAPIIPQVIAGKIEKKLINLIKFTPLMTVDTSLQGQAGMSVSFTTWNYINKAKVYDEGASVDREQITAATKAFVVKKIAKDIQLTDEAIIGTNGAVLNEVDGQLALSIADTIEDDAIGILRGLTAPSGNTEITQAGLAQLRVAFGEDLENTALAISPADYGKILAMKEFVAVAQGAQFMAGHVGHVMGLNIVVSGRLAEKEAYLIRAGGLGLSLKRQVHVESERLMQQRSQVVGADVHYVAYVRDETKLRKINLVPAVVVTP